MGDWPRGMFLRLKKLERPKLQRPVWIRKRLGARMKPRDAVPTPCFETKCGTLYHGEAKAIIGSEAFSALRGKVQMIFTSPPFPLNRKKRYGNLTGREYLEWLSSFGPLLKDLLTKDGSLVVEMGNSFEPGSPTMSTLPYEALLALKKSADLHLCQEFICFNPARLPSPTQWVNRERIRVKDSFTRIWWMSPNPRPKADNKRVLVEYSEAMKVLHQTRRYNPGPRPSEFHIGEKSFLTKHSGAIPPNVFVVANTGSNDPFSKLTRKKGLVQHPARMPQALPHFFIKFLTDAGDLVLDPFAGSNTTGYVAEKLERRWVAIESDSTYITLSKLRFELDVSAQSSK